MLLALTALAFGLPLFFVLRWIAAGGPAIWAADEFLPALLHHARLRPGRRRGDHRRRVPHGLPGRPAPRLVQQDSGALQLRHQFPARDRGGPGLRHGQHPAGARRSTRRAGLLVAAYVLLFLPRALVNLRAGLAQAPKELDEAAQALGKPPLLSFIRVTLRLTAPAAAGGAALVFLAIANELTATLLLSPNGTRTLATEFWSKSSEIDYAGAAPYALLMILLSAPMTYLLFQQSKKVAGQ